MNSDDPQVLKARIAFLENCIQVVTGQRETALNVVAELTVQRDTANRQVGILTDKLIALEAKHKTE